MNGDLDERIRLAVRTTTHDAPEAPGFSQILERAQRSRARSAALVLAVFAAAGLVLASSWPAGVTLGPAADGRAPSVDSATVELEGDFTPEFQALPSSPLSPRMEHSGVWTGDEFIVWGGESGDQAGESFLGDGAAYDPARDTWRLLPSAPISARSEHIAVWTGTEMIVWGGHDQRGSADAAVRVGGRADGAAYNPATNTWRSLPSAPPEAGQPGGQGLWVAGRLVVAGGTRADEGFYTARITVFDPVSGTWEVHPLPAPGVTAIGADDRVALLLVDPADGAASLAWFDPISGDVTGPAPLEPGRGQRHEALGLAWTGEQLLVTVSSSSEEPGRILSYRQDGLEATSVVAVEPSGTLHPPVLVQYGGVHGSQVWTGELLLLQSPFGIEVYDPADGTFRRAAGDRVRGEREAGCGSVGAARVWTGDVLYVWGGQHCEDDGPAQQAEGFRMRAPDLRRGGE